MTTKQRWEVVDSYGKVWFTGPLQSCGAWIDPILGVDFEGTEWGDPNIDADRFELNDDGSYTVQNYEAAGGVGGSFVVRRVEQPKGQDSQ